MLRRVLIPTVQRQPRLRAVLLGGLDGFYRLALLPFGRSRRIGVASESSDLVDRTDELNRAAEHYFDVFELPGFLLAKPFSDAQYFPRHLISLGTVLQGLRIRPGEVVLELGAGSCWVSHFLNRFGCRTISVDVSQTALDLGRQLFERDPATRWDLGPEFLSYDGRRLPVGDATCDKVIIVDAFHHVPNQRQILQELARVLADDGVVGMSEPGTGHADTEQSRQEVERFGVLENELVVEDVAALARSCGFADVRLIVSSPSSPFEIAAEDLGPFLRGKGFTRYWNAVGDAMTSGHYILLYKGDSRPTTRHPKAVGARIAVRGAARPVPAGVGQSVKVRVSLSNPAETRWLAGERPRGGWTRLGAHLYRGEELVDFDWLRVELPHDVGQYESVTVDAALPPLEQPGRYRVVFDLVIEGTAWLAERGSRTAEITLDVR